MSSSEKIPKAMAEKYAAISALTDAFCTQHLNEECREIIHRILGTLARKRLSSLSRGKENVWAVASVHAAGHVNFLNDATQTLHCNPKSIFEFFGIAGSTGHNKSREIRDLLKMPSLSPEWTIRSRLADNPMVWMLQVNGLVIDIRHAPLELQQLAFAKGLIPFIPAERISETI
jgi:hypothetical protein